MSDDNKKLKALRIKRRRRAAPWVRAMRHSFYLRLWRENGSLYSGLNHHEGSEDLAVWGAPAHLARVAEAGHDTGEPFAQLGAGGGNSDSEAPFLLLEHLLSIGVLGLRRDAETGHLESRFARPKSCRCCYGLPWHVAAERCDGCGLPRQECA